MKEASHIRRRETDFKTWRTSCLKKFYSRLSWQNGVKVWLRCHFLNETKNSLVPFLCSYIQIVPLVTASRRNIISEDIIRGQDS